MFWTLAAETAHMAAARSDSANARAPVLSCYDDLDASRAYAWQLLVRGANDRRSAFHTPCVANVARDGTPEARTVVLRGADPERWELRFHTDVRSGKYTALAASPQISLIAYDPGAKIQLRCRGRAELHHADEVAALAWMKSRPLSRVCYQQSSAPGTPLPSVQDVLGSEAERRAGESADELGRENFAVVRILIHEIEWLYLAAAGHRRALFKRGLDGGIDGQWLAP